MHVVGNRVAPADAIGRAHPAPRQVSVLQRRQYLKSSTERHENQRNGGGAHHQPIETALAEDEIEPDAAERQRGEHRDLVMSAQKGNAEKRARQCAVHHNPLAGPGAQQVKEHQHRNPHRAVKHLRPTGAANISGESEDHRGQQRRILGTAQVAAQAVAKQRGHEVNRDEIPVEIQRTKVAGAVERQPEEQPVERISGAGLGLAEVAAGHPTDIDPTWENRADAIGEPAPGTRAGPGLP